MFIQNEFCDGGSLQTLIEAHRAEARHFTEAELRRLLRQVAAGLQYVHGRQLAHLDVKPGNILLCHAEHPLEAGDQEAGDSLELRATYKLADFGHVVPLYGEDVEPEEGDFLYSFHCSLSCQFFLLYTVNFIRRIYVPVIILNVKVN